MTKSSWRVSFVVVVALAFVSAAATLDVRDTFSEGIPTTLFGPSQFLRTTGAPQTQAAMFSLPPDAQPPFQLKIVNSGVSSARIVLNDIEIVSPSSFNEHLTNIIRNVSLVANNVLSVRLAGRPGGLLVVSITATMIADASQIIGPQGGIVSVTNNSSPLFGTSVNIPEGALSANTRISIVEATPPQLPSFLHATGPAVNFLPDGLMFAAPVTITLPTTDDVNNGSSLIYLLTESALPVPEIKAPEDASLETHGQLASQAGPALMVTTDHFSARQVLSRSDINAALSTPFTHGVPTAIPIPVAECQRCISPRQVPIQQIIVHSTNDGGAPFGSILAWIHSTIGLPSEAFFATYYIDKAGRIVQLVDDSVQTAHIAGLNSGRIGIELYDGSSGYTVQQIEALVTLTMDLMNRHSLTPDDVFRHKDFTSDVLHQDPYRLAEAEWLAFKNRLKGLPVPSDSFQYEFTIVTVPANVNGATITATVTWASDWYPPPPNQHTSSFANLVEMPYSGGFGCDFIRNYPQNNFVEFESGLDPTNRNAVKVGSINVGPGKSVAIAGSDCFFGDNFTFHRLVKWTVRFH